MSLSSSSSVVNISAIFSNEKEAEITPASIQLKHASGKGAFIFHIIFDRFLSHLIHGWMFGAFSFFREYIYMKGGILNMLRGKSVRKRIP